MTLRPDDERDHAYVQRVIIEHEGTGVCEESHDVAVYDISAEMLLVLLLVLLLDDVKNEKHCHNAATSLVGITDSIDTMLIHTIIYYIL